MQLENLKFLGNTATCNKMNTSQTLPIIWVVHMIVDVLTEYTGYDVAWLTAQRRNLKMQ